MHGVQEFCVVLYSNLSLYWTLGSNSISIPINADLNTYKTPGNYKCGQNNIACTLKNCPTDEAFTMKVYYSTGDVGATDGFLYICQEIRAFKTAQLYFRTYTQGYQGANPTWKVFGLIPAQIS